jgi:transcriptional regulator with XRE-family HTH domain
MYSYTKINMIAELRKQAKRTQREVADALGITDTSVRRWEYGTAKPKLSFSQTLALCKILNCSLEQLVESENSDRQVA